MQRECRPKGRHLLFSAMKAVLARVIRRAKCLISFHDSRCILTFRAPRGWAERSGSQVSSIFIGQASSTINSLPPNKKCPTFRRTPISFTTLPYNLANKRWIIGSLRIGISACAGSMAQMAYSILGSRHGIHLLRRRNIARKPRRARFSAVIITPRRRSQRRGFSSRL